MADLLSKVKIGDKTYDLKDSDSRTKLTTLIGSNELKALGTAAWRAVAASISDGDGKIADAATVKAYVDAQIGQVKQFDIIVCNPVAAEIPAGAVYKDGETVITGTMAASADTMYKMYMVKNSDAGSGAYSEYISIRKGAGTEADPYVYSWEMIGSTVIDLSNYVTKTTTIAGIQINNGISVADLQTALSLGELAYKNKNQVQAAYGGASITGVKATGTLSASISGDLGYTTAAASLTKGKYTPSGTVNVTANDAGSVVTGGTINVTVKDAAAATAVTDITYSSYTPAGEISKPAVNLTSAEKEFVTGLTGGSVAAFTEGTFTPNTPTAIDTTKFNGGSAASYDAGFLSTGSQASFTQGAKASLTDQSKASFAKKVLKPAVSETDSECLIFSWVSDDTAAGETGAFSNAVTDRGTFTPNGTDSFTANTLQTLDSTKFHGGSAASLAEGFYTAGTAASKTADSFTPNVLQGTNKDSVNNITAAALASAPEFTGTAENIKFAGAKYLKQEIDSKTFSPTKGNLSFAGSEIDNFVTGVNYDKASKGTLAANASLPEGGLSVGTISVPSAKLDIEDKE